MNQVATNEALFSATYVDSYIDSVENLPDDVQRHLSRIRDIDVRYRSLLSEVDHYYDLWKSLQNAGEAVQNKRNRASMKMQHNLIAAQELGDEKMQIVNQLQELIDMKTRQLDTNQKNLDIKEDDCASGDAVKMEIDETATPPKQSRTQSPMRGIEHSMSNGSVACAAAAGISERHNSNGNLANAGKEAGFSGAFAVNSSSLSAEQNAERAGNLAGLAGSSNNSVNMCAGDLQRSASKRTRRRNENSAMELGGNESNSATEAGSNGGGSMSAAGLAGQERNAGLQKSSSSSGLSMGVAAGNQKKNTLGNAASGTTAVGNIAAGSTATNNSAGAGGNNNSGKKKKRKTRGAAGGQTSTTQTNAREETPPPDPIDPDEPTYCVCNQISFGEMILCDNDLCPIEWFHFSCVSLVSKPKGKWFCPNCRGDRPNVMKPKAQFLKELERYNKEKEEKT